MITTTHNRTTSRVLFTSNTYVVCVTRAGLTVQDLRNGKKGVCLKPDHPQYNEYMSAFETAFDSSDAENLCKSLTNQEYLK